MIDSFIRICLPSWAFCLERWERRVDQLRIEIREFGEFDHCFVHRLAANLWIDSSWSVRVEVAESQMLG